MTPADVLVEDGLIVAVGSDLPAADLSVETAVLSPGYVDLHVHALDGSGTLGPVDLPGLSRALARRGVTGFLATTIAAPLEQLLEVLQADLTTDGARCLGVHLEGPWLAASKAGAQPPAVLQQPSLADLERLLAAGPPVLLTLASELPGAHEVIREAREAGVLVSLGHSAATYDEVVAAVAAGARHITHCFNAMPPLHHRDPGLAGAALDLPQLTVEAIADGVHLHPAVVRLLWRAVGPRRLCLVSDAVDLGQGSAAARLPDGTLAGGGVGLDSAVRNAVSWGIPLADALTMASLTPASAIVRDHEIRPGAPADLVLLDDDLQVRTTLVGGEPV
jgi:N-acetylglucosamine-6-phosphate deacetylase